MQEGATLQDIAYHAGGKNGVGWTCCFIKKNLELIRVNEELKKRTKTSIKNCEDQLC